MGIISWFFNILHPLFKQLFKSFDALLSILGTETWLHPELVDCPIVQKFKLFATGLINDCILVWVQPVFANDSVVFIQLFKSFIVLVILFELNICLQLLFNPHEFNVSNVFVICFGIFDTIHPLSVNEPFVQ